MEAVGSASAIVGIVGFGLSIATTLQTYIESTKEADERLRDTAHDVAATASALQQLHTLIELDEKTEGTKIFSKDGLKGVNDTAAQCNVVFKRIVLHLNNAGYSDTEPQKYLELKISIINHLRWPWLEPRILRCRRELERLLLKLLLMLQVVTLAQYHKNAVKGDLNDFVKEEEMRKTVLALSRKEEEAAQRLQKDAVPHILSDSLTLSEAKHWSSNHGCRSKDVVAVTAPKLDAEESASISCVKTNRGIDYVESNRNAPASDTAYAASKNEDRDRPTLRITSLPATTIKPSEEINNFSALGKHPKPDASQDDLIDCKLEAWIAKGLEYILKMPVEQEEIMSRMQEVMNESSHNPWDGLLSLPAARQMEVAKVLELSKQGDNEAREDLTRILAAISIIKPSLVATSEERNVREDNSPTMVLFLKVKKPAEKKSQGNKLTNVKKPSHAMISHRIDRDPDMLHPEDPWDQQPSCPETPKARIAIGLGHTREKKKRSPLLEFFRRVRSSGLGALGMNTSRPAVMSFPAGTTMACMDRMSFQAVTNAPAGNFEELSIVSGPLGAVMNDPPLDHDARRRSRDLIGEIDKGLDEKVVDDLLSTWTTVFDEQTLL